MEHVTAHVANIFGFQALSPEPRTHSELGVEVEGLDIPSEAPFQPSSSSTRRVPRRYSQQSGSGTIPETIPDSGSQSRRQAWKPGWWGPMTSKALEEHNKATNVQIAWSRAPSNQFQTTPGSRLVQFIERCRGIVRGAEHARTRLSNHVLGHQDTVQHVMDFVGGPAPSEAGSAATIDPEDAPNGGVVRGHRVMHRDPHYGGRVGHMASDNLTVSTPCRTPTRVPSSSHHGTGGVINDPEWDVTRTPSQSRPQLQHRPSDEWTGSQSLTHLQHRIWNQSDLDGMLEVDGAFVPVLPGHLSTRGG